MSSRLPVKSSTTRIPKGLPILVSAVLDASNHAREAKSLATVNSSPLISQTVQFIYQAQLLELLGVNQATEIIQEDAL